MSSPRDAHERERDAPSLPPAIARSDTDSERTPLLASPSQPPPMTVSGSAALTSIARMQVSLSSLPSTGSNASSSTSSMLQDLAADPPPVHVVPPPPPSSSRKSRRVGLDAAVVHNQQKWKRLADISDDNSTAKDMASEVQHEFMQQRRRDHEQQRQRHLQQQQPPPPAPTTTTTAIDLDAPLSSFAVTPRGDAIDNLSYSHGSADALPSFQSFVPIEADKFLIAAAFVRDGIHGRKIGYRLDRTALFLNELFHSPSYRAVYMLVAGVACLLAFAETPSTLNDYVAVDIVCLVMFAGDVALRWYMSSDETKRQFISRQPWAYVRLLLVVLTTVDIVTHWLFPATNPHRYARALRPYFLVTRGRNIRIIFASCLRALRDVIIVLLLLACLIMFFGLLGFLVFSDYSDPVNAPFFLTLSSSLYTMVLVHNCLPYMVKSMYPYYVRSHWSALFFILFVLLTNLFLVKLTIAASYRSYKQHTEHMLFKRLQKRKAALFAAFEILAQDVDAIDDTLSFAPRAGNTSPLPTSPLPTSPLPNRPTTLARGSSRYFSAPASAASASNSNYSVSMLHAITSQQQRQLSIESWIRLCEPLKPQWTSTEARLVFNTVDVDHNGRLTLGDFYQLCALLNVNVERSSDRVSLLRKLFTTAKYHRIKKLRVSLRSILLHETLVFHKYPVVLAELVVGALICLSVVQAVQVNNIELAFSTNRHWRVVGVALLVVFTLEVGIKLFAFGRREFFARPFCKLDLAIVSVGWCFYALTTTRAPAAISLTLYDLALAVRSLRVLKLLNMVPPFHAILWTMKRIAALISQLLLVIFCVVYSFAIFTQANYGVALRNFPASKQSLAPNWFVVREEFQVDTFEQALVTLFGVANLAGWDMIMDAVHAVTQSDGTYVFFFSYRIAIANILLPIFVGFLVESFVSNAKAVDETYETYVEAAEHENMRDEDVLAVLESKDAAHTVHGIEAFGGGIDGPPASPVSASSDGDLRIKYQRRGSLVHNQMFDAVKISDVSRLTLLVEKKDDEIATQDRTIRQLENRALAMQSRASASQRLLLQYEAKMEELSGVLQEAKDELVRQQEQIDALERRPSLPRGSTSRRASWRVWNP